MDCRTKLFCELWFHYVSIISHCTSLPIFFTRLSTTFHVPPCHYLLHPWWSSCHQQTHLCLMAGRVFSTMPGANRKPSGGKREQREGLSGTAGLPSITMPIEAAAQSQITQQLCCYTLQWMEQTRQGTWPSSPYRPHLEKVFTDNVWTECSLANMYNHMFLSLMMMLHLHPGIIQYYYLICTCLPAECEIILSASVESWCGVYQVLSNPTPGKAVQDGSMGG